ncbi:hypothetical protein T484DRAFT_1820416 [Baffinella frigidus]|nr:hypothetical protein T484DRAFT_1820416 [Cryptophyta sp. CCMP2293]
MALLSIQIDGLQKELSALQDEKSLAVARVQAQAIRRGIGLQKELLALQDEKSIAVARVDKLQVEVDNSNQLVQKSSQQRLDAQANLSKDMQDMMAQVAKAQQEAAKKAAETAALKDRLMQENEAAQGKIFALREEGMATKLAAQEADFRVKELEPRVHRLEEDKKQREQHVKDLEAGMIL